MEVTTMQRIIDDEYGTFSDDVHESYLVNDEEVSRSMVVLQSTRVYSYDTGYLDMSWVITDVELDEDDE
jgi:hypothetical protein